MKETRQQILSGGPPRPPPGTAREANSGVVNLKRVLTSELDVTGSADGSG